MWKSYLKIYWMSTVWAKWQIALPKETREDLDMNIGSEYDLFMIAWKTFWIWPSKSVEIVEFKKIFWKIERISSIKIWTKYQFVIPSVVRKQLEISTWDNLLVLGKSDGQWVWFVKSTNMQMLFEYIKKYMD